MAIAHACVGVYSCVCSCLGSLIWKPKLVRIELNFHLQHPREQEKGIAKKQFKFDL